MRTSPRLLKKDTRNSCPPAATAATEVVAVAAWGRRSPTTCGSFQTDGALGSIHSRGGHALKACQTLASRNLSNCSINVASSFDGPMVFPLDQWAFDLLHITHL